MDGLDKITEIEKYVLNAMSEEDMIDFEERMLFDDELRQKVELYEMFYKEAQEISSSNQLVEEAELIASQDYYLKLAAVIIISFFSAALFSQNQGFQLANFLPDQDEEINIFEDQSLLASSFEPNPFLEDYITTVFRNDTTPVVIKYPSSHVELRAIAQVYTLSFQAEFPEKYRNENLHLKLYSNNVDDYLSEISLVGQPLRLDSQGNVNTEISIPLHPGLYYLVVENIETMEPRAVRRVWVR